MTSLRWRVGEITITKAVEREEAIIASGGDQSGLPDALPQDYRPDSVADLVSWNRRFGCD